MGPIYNIMKKALVAGSLFGISVLGGILFYNEKAASKPYSVLESFAADEKDLLEERFKTFSLREKGFLCTSQGRFVESDLFLQKALSETFDESAIQEIFLAKATNAYFEKHFQDVVKLVDGARKKKGCAPSLPFFEGLVFYLKGDYENAASYFQNCLSYDSNLSWSSLLTERLFPLETRRLYFAHALIEKGDLEKARTTLDAGELSPLATHLLALSYMKEAKNAGCSERESYLKMALFLFEKQMLSDSSFKDKILTAIEEETSLLLEQNETLSSPFLRLLFRFNANKSIDHLATVVAKRVIAGKTTPDKIEKKFGELVGEQVAVLFARALQEKSKVDYEHVWKEIKRISPSNDELATVVASGLKEEIVRSIYNDDEELTATLPLLQFWQKIEKDKKARSHFYGTLVERAKLLWKSDGEEKKGTSLLTLVLDKTEGKKKEEILKDLDLFFSSLYREAEHANMVARLSLVHDAVKQLDIACHSAPSKESVANYLADASYLFETHNYSSAKLHAEWVLKCDAKNEEALYLSGLASYHIGDYEQAISSLKKLATPNMYAQKALMLSEVYQAQAQEKHLVQRETLDDLHEDE